MIIKVPDSVTERFKNKKRHLFAIKEKKKHLLAKNKKKKHLLAKKNKGVGRSCQVDKNRLEFI